MAWKKSITSWFFAVISLGNFQIEDQFSNDIKWSLFDKVPLVLVFGGKEAAEESVEWGKYLHDKFNPQYKPIKAHLQNLDPSEKVKVVPVVTLPDVPSIFKGLFRSGFRKESISMGLGLDFGSDLSKSLGYDSDEKEPAVLVLKNSSEILSNKIELIRGTTKDEEVAKSVELNITKALKAIKN